MTENATKSATTQVVLPPPPTFSSVSTSEIQYLISGCFSNFRMDGRGCLDYRPYTTSQNHSNSKSNMGGPLLASNGSSRIYLPGSSTDVLCSVKADLVRPSPLHPDEGVIELHIDTLPSSSGGGSSSSHGHSNRSRRNEELELTSILNHILVPHIFNKKGLCVIAAKYVWRLHIDLLLLSCDGNVIDVCSFAIWSAVQTMILPKLTPVQTTIPKDSITTNSSILRGGKISDDFLLDSDVTHAMTPEGVEECPIIVTIYLFEKNNAAPSSSSILASSIRKVNARGGIAILVDPRSEEEVCSCSKISVCVDPLGRICGVHTYGSSSCLSLASSGGDSMGSIPYKLLNDITEVAVRVSSSVFESLNKDGEANSSDKGSQFNNTSYQSLVNLLMGHFELR